MIGPTATLTQLLEALDERELSARELLDLTLRRVEDLDGAINSVVTIAAERAHAEANRIDDDRANGRSVGALAGVPITIKDALATADIRSTGGAVELSDFVPSADAAVVRTVRDAGAAWIAWLSAACGVLVSSGCLASSNG